MAGGSSSSTTTTNVERPLTQEELDLIKAQTENANSLTTLAEESAARSQDSYDNWKELYQPLEQDYINAVEQTNSEMGTADARTLSNLLGAANSTAQSSLKQDSQALDEYFASRGMTGSGSEASAFTSLMQSINQTKAASSNDAVLQAIQQGDASRQTKLNNLAQVINVGRGGYAGSVDYQGLSGNQYSQSASANQGAYASWSDRWMQESTGSSSSSGGYLGLVGTAAGLAFSDIKLKSNLILIAVKNCINFYMWEWNQTALNLFKDKNMDIPIPFGVIAQEVEDIIKESVSIDDSGFKFVDYNKVYDYIKRG